MPATIASNPLRHVRTGLGRADLALAAVAGLALRISGSVAPLNEGGVLVRSAPSRWAGHTRGVDVVRCPVLVGRDEELASLSRALTAASSGCGSVAVVLAPTGVGKTRLVR